MRRFLWLLTALSLQLLPAAAAELSGDGLHLQPWFTDSFLELSDDLDDATADGKDLLVLFEQKGCPYCREMHQVNFARDEIVSHLQEHFVVVQLNLWGAREVVDMNGIALEERDLAAKWGINFTPTSVIFSKVDGAATEVFRMPGYFKPFHFLKSLEYVSSDAYKDQIFQRFLQAEFQALAEKGLTPEVW